MKLNEFIIKANKEELILIIPQGKDRSINHAFILCNGLIYDSTQEYPILFTENLFISFVAIAVAIQFLKP